MKQLAKVVIVLLGTGVGVLISYALVARADIVIYNADSTPAVIQEQPIEEKTIEEKIREQFEDVPIMIEVARCESQFKNVPGKLSDDFGPFQINHIHLSKLSELGLDREDADDNIKFARMLYEESGLSPWKSSKGCWGKYIAS